MCLAVPGKVTSIWEQDDTPMGQVDFGGVTKEVCLAYVPDLQVGNDDRANSTTGSWTANLVLDGDGHYNVTVAPGVGYDARLATTGSARINLGWTHTWGYELPKGQCAAEDTWNGSAWIWTGRRICAQAGPTMRQLSSTLIYRIREVD